MKSVVIYLPENRDKCLERLSSFGITPMLYEGFSASEMGVYQTKFFFLDGVKCEMSTSNIGCTLSHLGLWRSLLLIDGDEFLVLEDDAIPDKDWMERLELERPNVPSDCDILFVGSCNCTDKPRTQVAGNVWRVRWPFCTHAYIVKKRCLKTLIDNCVEVKLNIDIALWYDVFDSGKVKPYVILPRLFDQVDMELMP